MFQSSLSNTGKLRKPKLNWSESWFVLQCNISTWWISWILAMSQFSLLIFLFRAYVNDHGWQTTFQILKKDNDRKWTLDHQNSLPKKINTYTRWKSTVWSLRLRRWRKDAQLLLQTPLGIFLQKNLSVMITAKPTYFSTALGFFSKKKQLGKLNDQQIWVRSFIDSTAWATHQISRHSRTIR